MLIETQDLNKCNLVRRKQTSALASKSALWLRLSDKELFTQMKAPSYSP